MEWLYDGVNKTVPRNAGPECAIYLNPYWRNIETILILIIAIIVFKLSYMKIYLAPVQYKREDANTCGRRLLLVIMCIIWGMEIGYKFSSRTVIYLLNPCHVTTAIQIYLLAAAPSKSVTAIFRFHLNLLNGPLLAFLFPETDTRILPLESAIYWIQHGMMFIVPYYLLRLNGAFNIENFSDFRWNIFSFSINVIYHFGILQIIAIPTQVNLNHMLCPAILDPFEGQFYRTIAVVHQAILCPTLNKLFCLISYCLLYRFSLNKIKKKLLDESTNSLLLLDNNHQHKME